MASTWDDTPSDYNDNTKRQKPVYSQSFGRGGSRRNERDDRNRNAGNKWTGNNGNSEEKVIDIDTGNVGLVVGRGGATIRQLESDSHCRIFINRNESAEKTPIRIQGNHDDIESACDMITNLLSNGFSDTRNRGREDRRRNDRYSRDDHNGRDHGSFSTNNYQNDDYSRSDRNHDSNYSETSSSQNTAHDNNSTKESEFKTINWQEVYERSDRLEAERMAKLPKIIKKTYHENPEVASMSPEEVAEFRQKNMNISVSRVFAESDDSKVPIPNPIQTFEQAFGPYPEIMKTIQDQNFTTPSPIQCQAWPVIMSGEDMIGIAQTGTGKTLAFLLPAFLHIEAQLTPRENRVGPTVLILSPTRELALQIEKEINKYSYRNIKCVCVYGGGSRKDQITWIRRDNPEIIVATPGRLDDLVMATEVKLDSTTYIVLDEADKMLEMGFECQIRKILIHIRKDRQSIMTSATWPSAVRRLASQYSVNPVQVVVGSLDLAAVHSVTQKIIMVDEDDKRAMLEDFLRNMEPDDKVIVFCGKKAVTDDIASDLILHGVQCQSLHGDREQCDREQALHDLKTGEVHILIATDVAARGIDIPDITHIFNYDFPKNIEEYVHRIGRTGRAGRTGESISLFTRRDWANAADLIKILEEANQGVPEELLKMSQRYDERKERDGADRRGGRGGGFGGRRGGGGGRDGGFRDREGGRGGGFRDRDGGGRRGGGFGGGGRNRF